MAKKSYSSLILTDHSSHSPHDSIFKLAQCIGANERSERTVIASRSSLLNAIFFSKENPENLWAREVDDEFVYCNIPVWFSALEKVNFHDFDVIYLRMDHPVSLGFLKWIKANALGKLFINDPCGIIETSTKEYLLNFRRFIPWTTICTSVEEVLDISKTRSIVVKPLRGYGGNGILKIDQGNYFTGNTSTSKSVVEFDIKAQISAAGKILVNEYLENVGEGDKRTLVVNGKIVGTFLRLPRSGGWVCNLNQGGTVQASVPDPDEIEMASVLWEDLSKRGIVMFGFDTLMGNHKKRLLTEINTTNVGGFVQAEKSEKSLSISDVAEILWQYVEEEMAQPNFS